MTDYYKKITLLTLVSGIVLWVSDFTGFTNIGWIGWVALLFFVVITLWLTGMALKAGRKNNSGFVTGIMASTGIRMFLCLMFILGYWVIAGKRDLFFILYFFILYLFFTMFEIIFLVYKLRPDKKDGLESKTN